jgi:hypothetical protein
LTKFEYFALNKIENRGLHGTATNRPDEPKS